MLLGLSLAFASAVLLALNNQLGKFVSGGSSIRASLAVQYAMMAAFGAATVAVAGSFSAPMDALGWAVLAGCGVVGYLGVATLLLALRRMPVGIVTTVAYGYVFVAYLANAALFPELEKLSGLRLALGAAFFAAVALFLFERDGTTGKARFGKAVLFPLATALCWGGYMASMNWLLKTGRMTDVQTTLYSEGAIFLVALAAWALTGAWRSAPRAARSGRRLKWAYFGWGLAMYGGVLTVNMAFARAPANLVGVVALSSVVMAPAMGYFFFGERLTRTQLATGAVAAGLLGAFVLAG